MTTEENPPAISTLLAEHDLCRRHLEATAAALAQSPSAGIPVAERALGSVRSLLRFLEGDLETHIAREERALFPRLKAALPAGDRLIDEMVAEHDLVRIKRGDLRTITAALLDDHADVRLDREAVRAVLAAAGQPRSSLSSLRHAVDLLATKLRVHFENEEELVFPLAPALLSTDALAQIAIEMAALGDTAAITC